MPAQIMFFLHLYCRYAMINVSYRECARDKLVDRTATCRTVRC